MFGPTPTELYDVAGAQIRVSSLMAEVTKRKEATGTPHVTKPLVKLSDKHHHTIPVENGTPYLNGAVSNGVH